MNMFFQEKIVSYGGFFKLRSNIAKALDKDFGQNYEKLGQCYLSREFEENDKVAYAIVKTKHLDAEYSDVLKFLYLPDSEGSIPHQTCKKIYGLIKDIDFGDQWFRYSVYAHNDYEEFKEFLKECYQRRRKMRWS